MCTQPNPSQSPTPLNEDLDDDVPELDDEEYEIDYIVDARFKTYGARTVLEYLIHWKDYGVKDRSWTLAEQLDDDDPPVVDFYKKHPFKPRRHQRTVLSLMSSNQPPKKKQKPAARDPAKERKKDPSGKENRSALVVKAPARKVDDDDFTIEEDVNEEDDSFDVDFEAEVEDDYASAEEDAEESERFSVRWADDENQSQSNGPKSQPGAGAAKSKLPRRLQCSWVNSTLVSHHFQRWTAAQEGLANHWQRSCLLSVISVRSLTT